MDSGLCDEVVLLKVPGLSGNRLVFACTGPVNRDYDDVRRFSDAAGNGMKRSVGSTFFLFCFACINLLQVKLPLSLTCVSPQGPEGRYAAPTAGLPSTQGLSEQQHGGCSRGTSCTLHGEKGTEVENTKPLPTLLTTTHGHFSWKWMGSAGVFHL